MLLISMILGAGLLVQLVNQTGEEIRQSRAELLERENEDLLLPDMKISPPRQMYISYAPGNREIRFDTTFANVGEGPLELDGETDEAEGIITARQIIKRKDGGQEERLVGEFVFHPGHNHWHVDKYSNFQLWEYDERGEATNLLAETDKISFCIWDEHPYDLTLENAPQRRQYPFCVNSIQGNSVGWGDTYSPTTEGQSLNIQNIPDGKYLIRATVNVDNRILEKNYSNNVATLHIEIRGNNLEIIEGP